MNLLAHILQAGLKENHPSCNTRHCINRNQKRKQCQICVDVCPQHVYTEGQAERPRWSQCKNCGLCVSSCPARCIAPSGQNLEAQFALTKQGGPLRIVCHEAGERKGYAVPCLAAMPWEMLAYLALIRPLVFVVGACADCPHKSRVELVQRELGFLLQFLGEETYGKQVRLEFESGDETEEKTWSRRDLLQAAARKTAQEAGKLFAEEPDRYGGLFYREMLADLVRSRRSFEAEKAVRYCVELPQLTEHCYGCGNCAKLCPNQAFAMGPEKEGKRPVYITPWRCTGCGVCTAVCRNQGNAGMAKMRVPHLDRLLLTEVASDSCRICGRPMRPGAAQPCVICRQKKKKR